MEKSFADNGDRYYCYVITNLLQIVKYQDRSDRVKLDKPTFFRFYGKTIHY